jgi:hypothetical protein
MKLYTEPRVFIADLMYVRLLQTVFALDIQCGR